MNTSQLFKSKGYEWVEGNLYLLGDDFDQCGDTAWVGQDTLQGVRASAPAHPQTAPEGTGFLTYIVNRTEKGDKVYLVGEIVVFAGGAGLCYLEPIPTSH